LTQWKGLVSLRLRSAEVVILLDWGRAGIAEVEVMARASDRVMDMGSIVACVTWLFEGFGLVILALSL